MSSSERTRLLHLILLCLAGQLANCAASGGGDGGHSHSHSGGGGGGGGGDDSGLGGGDCGEDRLAMYRLTLHTLWDPETFPKQYPEWGPAASWSKVVGK